MPLMALMELQQKQGQVKVVARLIAFEALKELKLTQGSTHLSYSHHSINNVPMHLRHDQCPHTLYLYAKTHPRNPHTHSNTQPHPVTKFSCVGPFFTKNNLCGLLYKTFPKTQSPFLLAPFLLHQMYGC
jgi:hypothetical protein